MMEVKRIVGCAEISPVMSCRKLGADFVADPIDLVAKDEQKLPQSICSPTASLDGLVANCSINWGLFSSGHEHQVL